MSFMLSHVIMITVYCEKYTERARERDKQTERTRQRSSIFNGNGAEGSKRATGKPFRILMLDEERTQNMHTHMCTDGVREKHTTCLLRMMHFVLNNSKSQQKSKPYEMGKKPHWSDRVSENKNKQSKNPACQKTETTLYLDTG